MHHPTDRITFTTAFVTPVVVIIICLFVVVFLFLLLLLLFWFLCVYVGGGGGGSFDCFPCVLVKMGKRDPGSGT